jgi:protein-disulfide isomerase
MTVHNNQLSRWIFRGVIGLAVMLVTIGAVLLVSDNNTADSGSPSETDKNGELPEQSTNDQVSDAPPEADGRGVLPPELWDEILPGVKEKKVARQAVEHFGSVAMGSSYADVTIVEVGSYGCVSCRKVHQNGLIHGMLEQYPEQIRYIFIPWPVIHPNDIMATEAVLCAMDQGKDAFWAFHNALFDLTATQYGRYSTFAHYANVAESISDIDVVAFNYCLLDVLHRDMANALYQVGFDLNLHGTPSFFVNGELTSAYSLKEKVAGHLPSEMPDTLIQPTETSP